MTRHPWESSGRYTYPDATNFDYVSTHNTPSKTARVLEDGTTQLSQASYNDQGNVTSRTDPLGRQTTYVYAANGIDLLEVRQTSPGAM